MTPEQITLVRDSWEKVLPIKEQAAELFYGRLFEIAPQVQPLFKNASMQAQGAKLMNMIGIAVRGLNNPDSIQKMLTESGRRHVAYGVQDEHYDHVGEALLWTLEKGLGDAFTPIVQDAWVAAYGFMAKTMKSAGH